MKRIFSESFFGARHIFYNLPLIISKVGRVFEHDVICIDNLEVMKTTYTNRLILG